MPSFGLDRSPPFQFAQRLREFPPNLEDIVVLASTASPDISLVTKSRIPLADGAPSGVFTVTAMAEDSRRAQLPVSDGMGDTSPIGVALDLSSKDNVSRPLPKEEYEASQSPLPALMVLNNEGILSTWWFVYAESIRQGTTYPGLVVAGGPYPAQIPSKEPQSLQSTTSPAQSGPAFGSTTFGKPSTPAASPFGSALNPPSQNAFGSNTTSTSVFGAPSTFGQPSVPLGAQSSGGAFGKPAFGSSTPMGASTQGAAFGMTGGLGNRASPWGTPQGGTAAATGSVFGQSGFSASKATPFGASGLGGNMSTPTSGGFSSFASKPSPFMTAAPSSGSESPFGKPATSTPFGSGTNTTSSFGMPSPKAAETPQSTFGSGGFTLGSTFKGDGTSANDAPKPTGESGGSMFGSGFGNALGGTAENASQSKDAEMDDEPESTLPEKPKEAPSTQESTTPAATPNAPKLQFPQPSAPPKVGGLFGTQAQDKTTPAAVSTSQPTGFSISTLDKKDSEKPAPLPTTPKDSPIKPDEARPSIETSPKIKEEPHSDNEGNMSALDEPAPPADYSNPGTPSKAKSTEPPLPPESTSKASFAPGDSSNSSKSSDEAPLPPDFLPSKTKLKEVESARPEEATLPSGDEDDSGGLSEEDVYETEEEYEATDEEGEVHDEEGSGIDVADEISPTTATPKITPGSSFGAPAEKSPPGSGGLFSRITAPPGRELPKALFGEVGKTAPILPPPSKAPQQSPRSPSPVRAISQLRNPLRPDNARTVSAPGPFQALNSRKAALSKTTIPSKPLVTPEKARSQAREQAAAERARKKAEEEQDLSDHEDERVREELKSDVEGTLVLDPFLAHQDYVGAIDKPGVPGQIETLYRDINSMIDTLGLNARSLKAFIKGHEEMHSKDGARTRDDLERDGWCLIEIGDLPNIEDGLANKLESGRTRDVQQKLDECRSIRKDTAFIRAKSADIGRAIATHSDPDEVESTRLAPLTLDQSTQQHDLRKKMAKFQKVLVEAEENITLLRAKLASFDNGKSKGGSAAMKKPTVEAVTNTIKKMTSIAEKKCIDIEVLEQQMRGLRFSSLPRSQRGSRESTPMNFISGHPSPRRKGASNLGASAHTPHRGSLLGRSVGGNSPGKGVSAMMPEDVERYKDRARRRGEINAVLKSSFQRDGPRIRTLE